MEADRDVIMMAIVTLPAGKLAATVVIVAAVGGLVEAALAGASVTRLVPEALEIVEVNAD